MRKSYFIEVYHFDGELTYERVHEPFTDLQEAIDFAQKEWGDGKCEGYDVVDCNVGKVYFSYNGG